MMVCVSELDYDFPRFFENNNKYYETFLMKLLLNQRHRGKKGNGKKNIYFICKFHSIELC